MKFGPGPRKFFEKILTGGQPKNKEKLTFFFIKLLSKSIRSLIYSIFLFAFQNKSVFFGR